MRQGRWPTLDVQRGCDSSLVHSVGVQIGSAGGCGIQGRGIKLDLQSGSGSSLVHSFGVQTGSAGGGEPWDPKGGS